MLLFLCPQGGLIQLAEMAWHQGTDLYSFCNSRLFTCMVRPSDCGPGSWLLWMLQSDCALPLRATGWSHAVQCVMVHACSLTASWDVWDNTSTIALPDRLLIMLKREQ